MNTIDINYLKFQRIFIKWPKIKNAYDWWKENNKQYPYLNSIKLFKKYEMKFYRKTYYFIGFYPSTNNLLQCHTIEYFDKTEKYSIFEINFKSKKAFNIFKNNFIEKQGDLGDLELNYDRKK